MSKVAAKILIVEDEVLVARDLQHQLSTFGYEVVGHCSSGEEALEAVREKQPELVLMDIRLEGSLDGISAAEEVRTRMQIPVVYLTAHADDATIERARRTEPFGYILKPFDARELRTVIEMALYKHQSERKLRENERRFATTLSSIGDAIIATDESGRITFLNPVAEKLTGTSIREADDRPLDEVVQLINERTRKPMKSPVAKALKDRCTVNVPEDAVLAAKTGSETPIDAAAAPIIDDQGKCTGVVLAFRDVSERRRAEESLRVSEARFKAFMDHSPSIAFLKDAGGRYVHVNRSWQRQFNKPVEDWHGKTDFDLWPKKTAESFQRSDRQALESDEPVEVLEAAENWRGETLYWRTHKFRVLDLRGQYLIGGICWDITKQKQLEEQLNQAQKMESIGQLAGGIAHDFNNMLTAINGNCSLLLREMDSKHPWYEIVDDILRAGERAAELTRQLLAFSRKQRLQPKNVSLNDIVENVQGMIRRVIGENINFTIDLLPELGPIHADPGQIEQALINLAINARDAMPNGGKLTFCTFEKKLTAKDAGDLPEIAPGMFRCLSVRDTGHGMDESIRKHIFEPFFTTKQAGQGTGMGLATVYGIMKQSQGHVQVDSRLGRGSVFTLYFPAVLTEKAADMAVKSEESLPQGEETILLVEDEEDVRNFIRRILQQCGYTVLTAGNGLAALELSDRLDEEIHLLITDVVMPQLSGPKLMKELIRKRPHMKSFCISGYAGSDLQDMPAGASEVYLQKPFSPKQLADKVRETLDSK